MSVDRFWHWSCNRCGKLETRADYGLPRGWIYVKDRTITHACPVCAEGVSRERRGVPAVVAER